MPTLKKIISAPPDARDSLGPHPTIPPLVAMPKAPPTFGTSRSWFYREAAEGHIRLVKIGRGTYVDTESVLKRLRELPAAVIGGAK